MTTIQWLTPGSTAPTRGELQSFDAFEVSPVLVDADGVSERVDGPTLPALQDVESLIYTVFGHRPHRGVEALADFETAGEAVEVAAGLDVFRLADGPGTELFGSAGAAMV